MFKEETLEKVTMEMLEKLEYECINGYEMERTDFSKVLLEDDLAQAIKKINKDIKDEQVQEAVRRIRNLDHNNTILNNKQFTKYLLEGISEPIQENGETIYKTVKIVDFANISNNTFKAINQYTIIEHSEKRPDIIIFINGMPLVVVELKSTIREEVKLEDGYHQLMGYKEVHIPSLFYYNQFLIVSDGVQARVGTITSGWTRFLEWKKIEDTDEVKENMPTHQTLFNGMLRKDRLLDIINNFILWSDDNKILSAYHQYFGVKKAIESTEIVEKTRGYQVEIKIGYSDLEALKYYLKNNKIKITNIDYSENINVEIEINQKQADEFSNNYEKVISNYVNFLRNQVSTGYTETEKANTDLASAFK